MLNPRKSFIMKVDQVRIDRRKAQGKDTLCNKCRIEIQRNDVILSKESNKYNRWYHEECARLVHLID